MNDKCRTDSSDYRDPDCDTSVKSEFKTTEFINGRVRSWYIWAEPEDKETQVNLELGLKDLMQKPEAFEDFWTEIKLDMIDGKFSGLKECIDKYIEESIDLNEDNWFGGES